MDATMTHEANMLLPIFNKDDLFMDVLSEPAPASADEKDNKALVLRGPAQAHPVRLYSTFQM